MTVGWLPEAVVLTCVITFAWAEAVLAMIMLFTIAAVFIIGVGVGSDVGISVG